MLFSALCFRLAAAPCGVELTIQRRLMPRDPRFGGKRAAGAHTRFDRVRCCLAFKADVGRLQPVAQHCTPIAHVRPECRDVGKRIARHAPARDMAARARPALRMRNQARRDRAQLDVAHGRHQMRIVHRIRGKTALEETAGPALARVDVAGVAAVCLGKCGAQPVRGFGDEDEVDVIVHQTPGEAGYTRGRAAFAQQIEIEDAIGVREEDRLGAVAALGDVVRGAGDYDAGEAGHEDEGSRRERAGKLVLCPRISCFKQLCLISAAHLGVQSTEVSMVIAELKRIRVKDRLDEEILTTLSRALVITNFARCTKAMGIIFGDS